MPKCVRGWRRDHRLPRQTRCRVGKGGSTVQVTQSADLWDAGPQPPESLWRIGAPDECTQIPDGRRSEPTLSHPRLQAYATVTVKPSSPARLLKVGAVVLISGAMLLLFGAIGAFYFWKGSDNHVSTEGGGGWGGLGETREWPPGAHFPWLSLELRLSGAVQVRQPLSPQRPPPRGRVFRKVLSRAVEITGTVGETVLPASKPVCDRDAASVTETGKGKRR